MVGGAKCAKFDFGWSFNINMPLNLLMVLADMYQSKIVPSGFNLDMY
jgi:hypothetical protein